MSIRTTVTLDGDVLDAVKAVSRTRGVSFRETINDLLRAGLRDAAAAADRPRRLRIQPVSMGYQPGLNYDDVEGLIEFGEGDLHR